MKFIIPLVTLASLSGCAAVPAPFQASNQTSLVPFEQVIDNPANIISNEQQARWGGQIVGVQNKDGMSELEIVYFPESSSGKPEVGLQSPGRFKVLVEGNFDLALSEQDSLITVLGTLSAPESGTIADQAYTFPTLQATNYYVWNDTSTIDTNAIGSSYAWENRKRDIEGPLYGPNRSKLNKR